MLLYSLLHLTGYPLTIDEIKQFRQLGSRTAGHPEHEPHSASRPPPVRWGRASPMPSAWRWRKRCWPRQFNRPGHDVVDHRTWVFLGDGCLMEGISHEACSLAGTLKLGKLIAFYDDNGISIDGERAGLVHRRHAGAVRGLWLAGDPDVDGHDPAPSRRAIARPRGEEDQRPR